MKFIITESKLQKAALHWMNKNFGPDQLEVFEYPVYPNSIFYKKNGKVIMEKVISKKHFVFDYDEIWSFISSIFSMNHLETEDLLEVWLKETMGLEDYEADSPSPFMLHKWNELSRVNK